MSCQAAAIPPAGWSGRALKLLVGSLQLWGVAECIRSFRELTHPSLEAGVWVFVGLALWLFPFVVALGFARPGRASWRPLIAVGLVAGALGGWDLAARGTPWGPAVASWLLVVTIYTHAHLGASHVLAALIGLPGCEMRVLPYLSARLRDAESEAQLCLCPGFWTPLDRWEARLRGGER